MTIGQTQAGPQDRLSKGLCAASFWDSGGRAPDGGFLVFQDGMGSGNKYWCVNSTNGACTDGEAVVPQFYQDPSALFASRSGVQVIATAAEAAPEPATWALMLIGFAGLGYAGFRQSRTRGVSV